jgi:hypothetical protein
MPDSDVGIAAILNDIRLYTRMAAAVASKPMASRVLESYEKALVYSKLDGMTSTYKVAEATGIPPRTVLNWADDFVRANLAAPPDQFTSSHRALFSLAELSIDLTALKKRRKQTEVPQQSAIPTLDSEAGQPTREVAQSG